MKRKLFLLALTLGLGGNLTVSAQDDELLSPFEPSLGLAVPIKQGGEQVLVTRKFLLNDNVIISAGDQIRVIFQRPEIDDRDVRRKRASQNLENMVAKSRLNTTDDDLSQSALYRAALDRATKTVWRDEMRFRAYLDRMDLDGNLLVFQHPGSDTLTVDTFSFPQDLFLGEADQKITVLAVRKGSQSQKLGLRAGATLTALNGKPLTGLENFRDRYFPEKAVLDKQSQSLTVTFIPAGETAPREVQYKKAYSLSSNPLMMDLPEEPAP